MKKIRVLSSVLAVLCMFISMAPMALAASSDSDAHVIVLDSTPNADGSYTHSAACDGEAVAEYDYVWHADPSEDHGEVKNAPAEYYTGTEPGDEAVYIAHDVYYYPELDADSFVKVNYDGEQEWACYYTAEGYEDYIFATLPVSGGSVPAAMMHSEEEAYENAVLHITQAGAYILEGEWHGQIWIDLGDTDATFADESAKVTIILNGVDVTCTVAPALVFYSVYECDNTWENQTAWSAAVDTSDAGANVILADGAVNNFSGENVYRMLKTAYKSGDSDFSQSVPLQKKMRKLDGAFYSYVSMNIDGETEGTGVLNITAGYEGLDTELHLTFNGGNVNIYSQDDGINVNEDGVSVVTVNGGSLHILAGLGSEGDGVDSNGFLVINGGTVVSMANPNSDSGLDSDCGSYVNGGTVVAVGSTMDWAEADDSNDSGQVTMNLQFSGSQSADEAILITDTEGNVVFAYDPDKDEVAGSNARWYQGAVISCPGLAVGESYFVYVGGDVYGAETAGVYDVSTVIGFTDEAKQQSYTGTDVGFGGPGGGMGDPGGMGGPNEGFGGGERPEDGAAPEEGIDPGQMDGGTPPELPEDGFAQGGRPDDGFDPGEMGQGAGGEQGGFGPGQMEGQPGGMGQNTQSGTASIYFTMTDKVNGFSGVTDFVAADGNDAPSDGDNGFSDVTDFGAADGNDATSDGDNGFSDATDFGAADGNDATSDGDSGFSDATDFGAADGNDATSDGDSGFSDAADFGAADGNDAPSGHFADVAAGSWYASAVQYVYEKGWMTGTSNTDFSPSVTMTRGMLVTILYRMEGSPSVSGGTAFSDVASDQYYANAVAWASANGIVTGYDGNTFGPNDPLTREQLATVLYRYAAFRGYDVNAGADLSGYTDMGQIGRYAVEAMTWANAKEIISGTSATTLSPGGSATRAQVAVMLMRFSESV